MSNPDTANQHPTSPDEGPAVDESRLVALAYGQLRRLAHRNLEHEATGHTLTTTDLVHQAYLHLASQERTVWQNESHFMAIAASAMRRILVDHARSVHRLKRGGGLRPVSLDTANVAVEERAELLVALDEALDRLRMVDVRQSRVVECRFFAGMNETETAEALGVSVGTVRRAWMKAKAWLYDVINSDV